MTSVQETKVSLALSSARVPETFTYVSYARSVVKAELTISLHPGSSITAPATEIFEVMIRYQEQGANRKNFSV